MIHLILYSILASFILFKNKWMARKKPLRKEELIADYPLKELTHNRPFKKFKTTKAKQMRDWGLVKVKFAHESGNLSAIDNALDALNEVLKELTEVPAYERKRIVFRRWQNFIMKPLS